jgi:hypothetical protein
MSAPTNPAASEAVKPPLVCNGRRTDESLDVPSQHVGDWRI